MIAQQAVSLRKVQTFWKTEDLSSFAAYLEQPEIGINKQIRKQTNNNTVNVYLLSELLLLGFRKFAQYVLASQNLPKLSDDHLGTALNFSLSKLRFTAQSQTMPPELREQLHQNVLLCLETLLPGSRHSGLLHLDEPKPSAPTATPSFLHRLFDASDLRFFDMASRILEKPLSELDYCSDPAYSYDAQLLFIVLRGTDSVGSQVLELHVSNSNLSGLVPYFFNELVARSLSQEKVATLHEVLLLKPEWAVGALHAASSRMPFSFQSEYDRLLALLQQLSKLTTDRVLWRQCLTSVLATEGLLSGFVQTETDLRKLLTSASSGVKKRSCL